MTQYYTRYIWELQFLLGVLPTITQCTGWLEHLHVSPSRYMNPTEANH
jgi:hypothetical protein